MQTKKKKHVFLREFLRFFYRDETMTNEQFEMALGAVNGNFVPVCLRQSFKQICLVLRNNVLQARKVRLVLLAWPCISYVPYVLVFSLGNNL